MAITQVFGVVDFVVFGVSLSLSCAIGLYYAIKPPLLMHRFESLREKGHSNEDHLLGGRSLPLLPTALSLMSSVVSGIMILAYPAEIYLLGTAICWMMVGCLLALGISAAFFVPVIYRSVVSVSAYQYFEERFESRAIRVYASLLFSVKCIVYMAIVLHVPAVALSGVTNIPTWGLILFVGSLCTIYTTIGGLKAVIWTDAMQSIVMYAGLFVMVTLATQAVGSPSEVWRINAEHGRLDGFTNIDPNPLQYMTVWTAGNTSDRIKYGIGGLFFWLGTWSTNQMTLQRYVGMARLRDAVTVVLLTIPAMALIANLAFYTGLAMFAYYEQRACDPLSSGALDHKDKLVTQFMVELMGDIQGMPGLFLSCLLSGTLSSISSGINSLSAVGWEEFLRPCLVRKIVRKRRNGVISTRVIQPTDRTATVCTKLIGVAYGVLTMSMAFSAQLLGPLLQQFESPNPTMTAIAGPLLGLMILGVFFPSANAIGSFIGMLCGSAVSLWILLGSCALEPPKPYLPLNVANCTLRPNASSAFVRKGNWTEAPGGFEVEDLYRLSFFMYPVLGVVTTILVSLPVSACTGGSQVWKRRPELFFHWWWKPQPMGARHRILPRRK